MASSGTSAADTNYTPQYKTITGTGHTRPTQEIGAPTLIWHVAVWPKRGDDPQDAKPKLQHIDVAQLLSKRGPLSPGRRGAQAWTDPYDEAALEHNRRRNALIGHRERTAGTIQSLNDLVRRLQLQGRTKRTGREPEGFDLHPVAGGTAQSRSGGQGPETQAGLAKRFWWGVKRVKRWFQRRSRRTAGAEPFRFPQPGSLGFTLWWRDPGDGKQEALERPGYAPLRVRVQVEVEVDYYAITFLIDVGNPWNAGQVFSSEEAPGERRKKIFKYAEDVRRTCEAEFTEANDGSLEKPLVPLDRVPPPAVPPVDLDQAIRDLGERIKSESVESSETEVLLDASKYLYATVWNDFCKAFEFEFKDIAGPHGEVFANFRGLVMSTDGADELRKKPAQWQKPVDAKERHATATPGVKEFRRFDSKGAEPNAIIKAYWPFIRRMKPFADYREYVACGVLNWRALYITALGSQSEYDIGDESTGREYEVPSLNLPELSGWLRKEGDPPVADDPLLGPKGEEPVRYLILTKCEPHRRQLGRIVDRINALGVMRLFALKEYAEIHDASEHVRMRGQQLDQVMAAWIRARKDIEIKYGRRPDRRNAALSALNEYVELQLIDIAAGLDRLSDQVTGGLPYRIARSRYFARRFNQMRKTLVVGNIESWTSYDQFASRGLQPVFDFIEGVGHRLRALRLRLTNVMQSIQTSALVSQSEETRKNTRRLELLYASTNSLSIIGVWGVLALWLQHAQAASEFAVRLCSRSDLTAFGELACRLHAQGLGHTSALVHDRYVTTAIIFTLLLSIFLALRRVLRWLGIVPFALAATILTFAAYWLARASQSWLPAGPLAEEFKALVHPLFWVAMASAALCALSLLAVGVVKVMAWLFRLIARRAAEAA